MNKKISIIIYSTGSILLSLPLILLFFFENKILTTVKYFLIIKFNLLSILILLIAYLSIIIFELYIFKNNKQIENNLKLIEMMFGEKRSIKFNILISLLSGYFEELLFRVYLYIFLTLMIKNIFINTHFSEILIIVLISVIFGIFHITQGIEAFIISFTISIIFFISLKLSNTIWYAMITHSIINFSEFQFIIPFQKKRI